MDIEVDERAPSECLATETEPSMMDHAATIPSPSSSSPPSSSPSSSPPHAILPPSSPDSSTSLPPLSPSAAAAIPAADDADDKNRYQSKTAGGEDGDDGVEVYFFSENENDFAITMSASADLVKTQVPWSGFSSEEEGGQGQGGEEGEQEQEQEEDSEQDEEEEEEEEKQIAVSRPKRLSRNKKPATFTCSSFSSPRPSSSSASSLLRKVTKRRTSSSSSSRPRTTRRASPQASSSATTPRREKSHAQCCVRKGQCILAGRSMHFKNTPILSRKYDKMMQQRMENLQVLKEAFNAQLIDVQQYAHKQTEFLESFIFNT